MLVAQSDDDYRTWSTRHNQQVVQGLRSRGYSKRTWPDKPLISVIIPVLNREQTLEKTIRSVLNQEYENVELIIIDGGSSDRTPEILKKYDAYIDIWLTETDKGIYDAMNKGVRLAHGDWLYFLGSDDILLNALDKVAAYLKNQNEIYYGDVYLPTWHKIYDGPFTAYKLMKNNIPHQATFYPKHLFQKHYYDLKYKSAGDYYFNIKCFNDANFRYLYMPILVAIFDDAGGISARIGDPDFEKDRPRVLREHFGKVMYYKYSVRKLLKKFEKNFLRKITHLRKNW
jgi:glycosyltransferase involved in cell wall biosynthesis